MNCINKSEAQRVAYFGFRKMEGQYYMQDTCFNSCYKAVKASDGTTYAVRVNNRYGRKDSCSCPFFEKNAEFGVCKHIYFIKNELAYAEDVDRRADEREAAMLDMELLGKY